MMSTEWTAERIDRFIKYNFPIASDFRPRYDPVAIGGWEYNQQICAAESRRARARREKKKRLREERIERYYAVHPEMKPRNN